MSKGYRKPHTFKKKRSIFREKPFWFSLLGITFFCSLIYCVYFWDFFQIKNIEVGQDLIAAKPGVKMVPEEDIATIKLMAEKAVDKKIIFLKTRSIFLLDSGKLEKEILTAIPQLESADVERKFFNQTLNVSVNRKEGLAIFLVGDSYLLMDKGGKLFDTAEDLDREGLVIISKPDYSFDSGETVLGEEELAKIIIVKTKFESLGVNVAEFIVSAADKLVIRTAEGFDVYFNLQSDIDWQIVKLDAVLDEKIPQEKRGDLEYIEVRFGNLAPYKYK
jgi:hypothetical protein